MVARRDGNRADTLVTLQQTSTNPSLPGGVLASYGSGVLAATYGPPFGVVWIDGTGIRAHTDTTAIQAFLASAGEQVLRPYWVTTAVVPTDRGWLQVISDLRTDTRVLITFDDAGTLVRTRILNAPFGLLTSRPDDRTLLAARDLGNQELVLYRWRWRVP